MSEKRKLPAAGIEKRRSTCPIASTLDIVGDRWSLLIIRDLLTDKTRYGELLASGEKIPTNILSDRLKRLERAGLVATSLYSEHPPRYEYRLTLEGRALEDTLIALARWGLRYIPGTVRGAFAQRASLTAKPRSPRPD